jgi:hypothetical protein
VELRSFSPDAEADTQIEVLSGGARASPFERRVNVVIRKNGVAEQPPISLMVLFEESEPVSVEPYGRTALLTDICVVTRRAVAQFNDVAIGIAPVQPNLKISRVHCGLHRIAKGPLRRQ